MHRHHILSLHVPAESGAPMTIGVVLNFESDVPEAVLA